jgi:hypothetical protein
MTWRVRRGITDIKGQCRRAGWPRPATRCANNDRVFASLPVRTLLAADGPIRALQDEGYMLIPPPGDEVAVGHREQDGAPPRRVGGQGEHR